LPAPASQWADEVALRRAAGRGDVGSCTQLVRRHAANVNAADESGGQRTPLHAAAEAGHAAAVRCLGAVLHADLDARTAPHGYTPLHLAAENGHAAAVRALLAAGANSALVNLYGETARDGAEANGHTAVLKALDKAPGSAALEPSDRSLPKRLSMKKQSVRGVQRVNSCDSAGSS
jgi:ankyrin repeat protein